MFISKLSLCQTFFQYTMLSGKVPFQPKQYTNHSAQIIMKNIMCGDVTFEGDEWNGVSHSAKNLIQGMQNFSYYWKVLTGMLWRNSFAYCIIPVAGSLTNFNGISQFSTVLKTFLQKASKIFCGTACFVEKTICFNLYPSFYGSSLFITCLNHQISI